MVSLAVLRIFLEMPMPPPSALISGRYLQWLDAYAAKHEIVLRDLASEEDRIYWRGTATAAEIPCLLFATLLEACALRTRNDAFSLSFAQVLPPRPEGVYHTILAHADTLRDAFCAMCRLSALLTGALSLSYCEDGDSGSIEFTFPPRLADKQQFIAGEIAIIALRVKELSGSAGEPSRVEFTFARPRSTALYKKLLGENIRYGGARNSICFPLRLLHAPLPRTRGARSLADKAHVAGRVADFLKGALQRGEATETNACRALAISRRTLQRDLLLAGTSFRKLLESERRASAEYYLTSTSHSLSAISALLGYSEQSAFSRACRAWFGKPPSAVRSSAAAPTAPQASHEAAS